MKNLASGNHATDRDSSVDQMLAELKEAGIHATVFDGDQGGEVPGHVIGSLQFWSFHRAWYYWVAKGPGIPVELAEKLHATHGKEVRVAGHCGCPSPREWYKGNPVPAYHVDSQAGLNALAETILAIYDPRTDPNAAPYCGWHKEGEWDVLDLRSKEVGAA